MREPRERHRQVSGRVLFVKLRPSFLFREIFSTTFNVHYEWRPICRRHCYCCYWCFCLCTAKRLSVHDLQFVPLSGIFMYPVKYSQQILSSIIITVIIVVVSAIVIIIVIITSNLVDELLNCFCKNSTISLSIE